MGKKRNIIDTTLPHNLALLMKMRAEGCPNQPLQASKDKTGTFLYYSYSQVYREMCALALSFAEIGITRGDHVALFSDNCREWLLTDFAILMLGACDVPRGTDSMANELQYIINFSECRTGVFENERQFLKVAEKKDSAKFLKTAIFFVAPSEETKAKATEFGISVHVVADLLEKGLKLYEVEGKKEFIEAEMEKTQGDDLATILFTSGTTGIPKGVMLTHRNYLSQMEVVHNVLPVKPGEMWLTVLPIWHSFERCIEYIAITFESGIAYSKPVPSMLLGDFAKVKPQWMCGVPRLWESLAKGVYRAMEKEGGIKYAMFRFFIGAGGKYAWAKENVTGCTCRFTNRPRILDFLKGILPMIFLYPVHALGEALVYKKIREKLGGRIIAAISGGGALQAETDIFYRAIGFTLLEGYGITEAAPILSVRSIKKPRPGCVGEIYPSATVKIVAEKHGVPVSGEPLPAGQTGLIFARGDQIMKGYYNQPELTSKVLDEEGWLNTGDLGMLTVDGEIKITGRAKDTIVLQSGENIEPLGIEMSLCGSDYVETAVVFGQDQKVLGALIVPVKDSVLNYAKSIGLEKPTYRELLDTDEIQKLMKSEIDNRISAENGFRTCERIGPFSLLEESFTVGKELSAKQEFMRYKVAEIYKAQVDAMFI